MEIIYSFVPVAAKWLASGIDGDDDDDDDDIYLSI